jgi:hypothetical protein
MEAARWGCGWICVAPRATRTTTSRLERLHGQELLILLEESLVGRRVAVASSLQSLYLALDARAGALESVQLELAPIDRELARVCIGKRRRDVRI